MIAFANEITQPQVRQMWKTCFGDSDDYMDIYFREKYRNEQTLVYLTNEKAVSSLQMLPFNFSFHGSEIPVAYFSGLCTLPEARKKGFMGALIEKSFDEMGKNGVPLTILVPQDESVMNFYRSFGFAQTFDAGEPLPDLRKIISESDNLEAAYEKFDSFFRRRDMTVQKSFDDFRAIVEEAALFHFPAKKSLIGMSRVINAEKLLSIFAKKYPEKHFSLQVSDELINENCATFVVENGVATNQARKLPLHYNLQIEQLTQLILGYWTSEQTESLRNIFPQKQPLIGFMME